MSPSSLPDVSADRLNGNGNEDAFSQFLREAEEAMANDLHELADELCSVLSASYHSKLSEVYQEHRRVCHKLEDESNSSLGSEIAATQAERQRQVTEGSSASLVSGHSRSRQVSNLSAASKQVSNMSNYHIHFRPRICVSVHCARLGFVTASGKEYGELRGRCPGADVHWPGLDRAYYNGRVQHRQPGS